MTTSGKISALVLLLTTVGCDRVTKHLATTHLAGMSRQSYLADTFRLEYAENPGAFLSLGSGLPDWARTSLLTVGAGLALIALGLVAFRLRWTGFALVGTILLSAGGVSNLMDRIARGSVVDFMNVGIGSLRSGIFNVADIAVLLGAIAIVIGSGNKRNGPFYACVSDRCKVWDGSSGLCQADAYTAVNKRKRCP